MTTTIKTTSALPADSVSDPDRIQGINVGPQGVTESDQALAKSREPSSQTEKKICRTALLLDEPGTDVAVGGPHERIAENIAALIRPADAKGISIGLEGSWGSGKSTVAKLLARKLESDKGIAVISFDAWAHEGDPLRRTFLETLIRRLQSLDWIDQENWKNKIEELANRREVVRTKDRLDITPWGIRIVLALLLVPIGAAFISAALDEKITLVPGMLAWKFIILFSIGLALTSVPALILLRRYQTEPDILNFFFHKGPTGKTTETNKTVNPTSIEFEDNFTTLVAEALEGEKKREEGEKGGKREDHKRIVIVLDNLDRVDADDALVVWSTLQTFLQHKDTDRPAWRDRLWIVVLYDLKGLSMLWQGKSDEPNKAKTAASFIDKSFQIRFEVPALVLSDWRSFLMAKLQEAFPDHNDSDHHEVYRVMAIGLARGNRLPTIRELKLFVNQIGAIHRQWAGSDRDADTFPLAHIAYYVLLRRENQDIINQLLSSTDQVFPPKEYRDLLGGGVRENLAAMSFNVDVGIAQQLLFTDRIKNALTFGSSEQLRQIQSVIPRGFWETFEQIVTTEWTGGEMVRIADAAWALEQSGLLAQAPAPAVRLVTRSICQQASAVEAWSPLDENKAQGLATIIKWKNEAQSGADAARSSEFIEGIFKGAALGLKAEANRSNTSINAKDWLRSLTVVLKNLQPTLKTKALETVVGSLSAQLKLPDPLNPKELETVLEVLSELQEQPDADAAVNKSFKELVDTGKVARQIGSSELTPSSVAWTLYVLFRYSAFVDLSSVIGATQDQKKHELEKLVYSDAVISSFTEKLQRFNQLPLLFTALSANEELKYFVVPSLKIALKAPTAYQLFTTPDGFERLEFITKELAGSDEEEALLSKLVADVSKDVSFATGLSTRQFNHQSAKLYLLILDALGKDNDDFVSWCINGLELVSAYVWAVEFNASGKLLNLALRMDPPDREIDLGVDYYKALKKYTDEMNAEPILSFPVIFPGNAARLLGAVDSELRSSFRDYLCSLGKSPSDLHKLFFNQFGVELATQLLQSTQGRGVLELFIPILDQTHVEGLKWINETLSNDAPALLNKYSGEPALAVFRTKLRRILPRPPRPSPLASDVQTLLLTIASVLKIEAVANGSIAFSALDDGRWRIHVVKVDGSERGLLETVETADSDEKMQPAWSPDGLMMAYTAHVPDYTSEIRVVDLQRNQMPDLVIASDQRSHSPAWSPDGKTIAFVKENEQVSNIYTIQRETKEERKLTEGGLRNAHPSWSPEGDKIVFQRVGEDEQSQIFVMNADGSDAKAITDGPHDFDPSWSPDGNQIAFARRHSGKVSIYLMDPIGGDQVQLIEQDSLNVPVWSPEGDKILFQVGLMDDSEIVQIDADGKNKKLLGSGIDPNWGPLNQSSAG